MFCPCCGEVPHPPSAACSFDARAPGATVGDALHPLVVTWLRLGGGKRHIEVRVLDQETWPFNVAARDEHGGMVDVRGPTLAVASYNAALSFMKAAGLIHAAR